MGLHLRALSLLVAAFLGRAAATCPDNEIVAKVTLCDDGALCNNDPLYREYCLGQYEDTPGNIFDSDGDASWYGRTFNFLKFEVDNYATGQDQHCYLSMFQAEYCTGFPHFLKGGGPSDGGFYTPGTFPFPDSQISCLHPYYWPGADARPQKEGVGVKLTLWPAWSDETGRPYPYDQTTCTDKNHPIVDGMQDYYGVDCASGDDGIYCMQPDTDGANDAFISRLDFAGDTYNTPNSFVQAYVDKGNYPVGAILINTFFSVHGGEEDKPPYGWCSETQPWTPGFCNDDSVYTDYCIVTRFSADPTNTQWEIYDAEASADWNSVCSSQPAGRPSVGAWGAMFHANDDGCWTNLRANDGSIYCGYPLRIANAWTKIIPCNQGFANPVILGSGKLAARQPVIP